MGRHDGWEHTALRILEVLSATWGGAGDVIVTSGEDGTADESHWSAVELYDPDVWATYVDTYRAFEMRDPDGFNRFLDEATDNYVKEHGGDREQRRASLHDLFMRDSSTNWQVPESFWDRARARRAPSWDREFGHAEIVCADADPTGLLVDITQLSPVPTRVVVPKTDSLPLAARVIIAAKWGCLAPGARERLEERGVPVRDVEMTEADLRWVVGACWGANPFIGEELRKAIADAVALVSGAEADSADLAALDEHCPFAMTMRGLGWFSRPLPIPSDLPLAVVVGETADDFALALILDRCMRPAIWLPPSLLGDDSAHVLATAVSGLHAGNSRDRRIHLTSCSLGAEDVEPLAVALAATIYDGNQRVVTSFPVPLPEHRPMTIMDRLLANGVEDELFIGDTTGRGIRARLPSGLDHTSPFGLSWWNDVVRWDHQLPPRWALNEHLVARSSSWKSRARVTDDGIAFHSHPLGFISGGNSLAEIVDNPQLRFLAARDTFDVLAAEAGARIKESAAGLYTARAADLWGGVGKLTAALRTPLVRVVLDAYASKEPSGTRPGNYINERRYLSLDDLSDLVAGDEQLVSFVDESLASGLLRRGLCLACSHCRHFNWYDADDAGRSFRCARCRTEVVVDSTVVRGGGSEPRWYFSLAEVVFQAAANDFNVPVLALDTFAAGARSVLAMTDQDVTFHDGQVVEVDIWGIVDGRIVIGEARTNDDLGSSAGKRHKKVAGIRQVAEALTADVVVFATAAPAWSSAATTAIENGFAGAPCELRVLCSVDPHLASPPEPVGE